MKSAANTIASSVYQQLREDLISGIVEPGAKLRIEWVVNTYGGGASPVREALNRLSSEGLIEQRDQRGFYALNVSVDELEELTRTRCMVEELALRQSIRNRTPQWEEGIVLALHRLLKAPRFLLGSGDRNPEWEVLHRSFHRALIEGCGSGRLVSFCEQLADQAYRYRKFARGQVGDRRDDAAEHREIAESTIGGDEDAAVSALQGHFVRTKQICIEGLHADGLGSDIRL